MWKMDIEAGYKMTEFGLIPEDWVETTWGECLTTFSSGATPYRGIKSYYDGPIRWISSGELNYNRITETIEHISQEAVKDTNLKIHKPGTFLMAITGLEAEGTRGRCAIVGAPSTTNQSCLAVNGTDKVCTEFLYEFYKQFGTGLAFKYCQGTKQQSFTADIVKKLPIIYPPTIEEQKRISEILCEMDEIISGLNQEITKKNQIKEGVMQKLLTGKTRLAGFSGEWVETKLGDVAEMNSGGTPSSGESRYYGGDIPFLSISDMTVSGKFISTTEKTITKLGLKSSSARCFPSGTLMLAMYASLGKCSITKVMTAVSQAILGFKLSDRVYRDFLYYHFCYIEENMKRMGQTGTQSNLSKSIVENIMLRLPSIEEQTAIANILSDLDEELKALEAERDKYALIKQGMMQKLLTGQIRIQ